MTRSEITDALLDFAERGDPLLSFDEERHLYWHLTDTHARWLPSCTQVIDAVCEPAGDAKGFVYLQHRADTGTDVHDATYLSDMGLLDEDSLTPQVRRKLNAWHDWKNETGFQFLLREQRLRSAHGYGCTADAIGWLDGRLACVEIKGPWMPPSARLQTAAQCAALHERTGVLPELRLAVSLTDSGPEQSPAFTDPRDFRVFLSALHVFNWRVEHVPGFKDGYLER